MIEFSTKTLYSTKEAAERIGRSRNTILQWDRLGLIKKAVARDRHDNRQWTDENIAELITIRDLMDHRRKERKGGR